MANRVRGRPRGAEKTPLPFTSNRTTRHLSHASRIAQHAGGARRAKDPPEERSRTKELTGTRRAKRGGRSLGTAAPRTLAPTTSSAPRRHWPPPCSSSSYGCALDSISRIFQRHIFLSRITFRQNCALLSVVRRARLSNSVKKTSPFETGRRRIIDTRLSRLAQAPVAFTNRNCATKDSSQRR